MLTVRKSLFCRGYLCGFILDDALILVYMLFGKFYFKSLKLDFFREKIEFPIIADIVELNLVSGYF